jgi:hypothetical protein
VLASPYKNLESVYTLAFSSPGVVVLATLFWELCLCSHVDCPAPKELEQTLSDTTVSCSFLPSHGKAYFISFFITVIVTQFLMDQINHISLRTAFSNFPILPEKGYLI